MKSLHILPCAMLAYMFNLCRALWGILTVFAKDTFFLVHHVFYQCYHLGKWYECYINIYINIDCF